MAYGDTKQTIISGALYEVGCPPILDITIPKSPAEAIMLNRYNSVLLSELRKNQWVFAITRLTTLQDQTPIDNANCNTIYTWPLPQDCVRPILDDFNDRNMYADWWIEGSNIVSKHYKAPFVRYISSNVDESIFDPIFTQAFTYRLALECCEFITQSSQKKSDLNNLYQASIDNANKQNAFEDPQSYYYQPERHYNWLESRYDFYKNMASK